VQDLLLDHVGVAVTDLGEGAAAYRKIGFTLTTRSVHEGRATGNHCVMLDAGYIELIGIANPSIESSFHAMVERYEGIHIVAFGCGNAAEAAPVLQARHEGIGGPELLERQADFGPDNQETRRAAFRNIYTDASVFPEARFIFIEHETPDVLWQPHLLTHPNGAVGLAEIAICAPDADVTAARLATTLAVSADAKGPGIYALDLARGRVYVLSPEVVPKWAPGVEPPAVPSVVGLGVSVVDLDQTKAFLDGQGVRYHAHPYPAIWLEPVHGRGAVVSFIESS
jgi:hypothetical protein